jgi:hypothetical protein
VNDPIFVPFDPATGPVALQFVDYNSATDLISPAGRTYRRAYGDVAALLDDGYRVAKSVTGWGEFTHLLQVGTGGWALASFRDNADSIMYQAGRDAHRDGAPAPGEYCVEGDAYRAGWYDADEDAQGAEE